MRLLVSWLLFVPTILVAQINFESDFKKVLEKSKTKDKIIFVEYYNPNCHYCTELDPFLEKKEVGDYYNEHFINYKMNAHDLSEREKELLESNGLKSLSFPLFLFFDSEEKFIHHSSTQKDVDFLVDIGKSALNSFERTSGLEKKYNDGDRTVRTLYAYCNLLKIYNNDSLIRQVADDLYEAFDEEKLPTRKSFMVLNKCVNHPSNGFFQFWIDRLDELEEVSELKNDGHLHIMQRILMNSINNDEISSMEEFETIKDYVLKTNLSDNPDRYLWRQKVELLQSVGKEDEALDLVLEIAKSGKNNVAAVIYPLEFGFNTLKSEKSYDALYKKLSSLNAENTNYKIGIKYYFLKYKYFANKADETNATKAKEKIISLADENGLTSSQINEYLGENLIKN